ncbi:hypothetical protein [Streptomyces sp. NPDC005017]|uniref:hypothetical protein n=1 Tax=Streptomyces sp. NPDC005017 TaxID=3364706 RepID=UPI0036BEFD60
MSTSRPMLSQSQAAACGVSRTTIRRRREVGALPGTVEDGKDGYLIPVEDLLAAGFRLNAPAPPDLEPAQDEAPAPAAGPGEVAELRTQLAENEARNLRERLDERAEHIADLQKALKALTPAPERPAIPQPAHPVGAGPAVPAPAPVGPGRVAGCRRTPRPGAARRAAALVVPPRLTTRHRTSGCT